MGRDLTGITAFTFYVVQWKHLQIAIDWRFHRANKLQHSFCWAAASLLWLLKFSSHLLFKCFQVTLDMLCRCKRELCFLQSVTLVSFDLGSQLQSPWFSLFVVSVQLCWLRFKSHFFPRSQVHLEFIFIILLLTLNWIEKEGIFRTQTSGTLSPTSPARHSLTECYWKKKVHTVPFLGSAANLTHSDAMWCEAN